MRIQEIFIAGYGQFVDLKYTFHPGLQIVIGPNEKGKSTIRAFIGDMLYGQKRSTIQRSYDESNELRIPWGEVDRYGGSLRYELDDGKSIEVIREFHRDRESIQLFDHKNGQDISGQFERLRNRELNFATKHLGLSKDVFLNTATISHFTLEDLGDTDALKQIREKILSLADSGIESGSSDMAVKKLHQRIQHIGQPTARTKPLPKARMALEELEAEHQAACERHREYLAIQEERSRVLKQAQEQRHQRLAIEEELRIIDAHERRSRLDKAEQLMAAIEDVTRKCFSLSAAKNFPLDTVGEVRRLDGLLNGATAQANRSQDELKRLQEQINTESTVLQGAGASAAELIPEQLSEQYFALQQDAERLTERCDDGQTRLDEALSALNAAQENVAAFPDFSRLSADPVEWLTQLASSFTLAVRSRDEESSHRDRLRKEVRERREKMADLETLFAEVNDFEHQVQEFENIQRVREEEQRSHAGKLTTLKTSREDAAEELPGFLLTTIVLGIMLAAIIGVLYFTQKTIILFPTLMVLLAMLYFLVSWALGRVKLRHLDETIAETSAELEALQYREDAKENRVPGLMESAQCETIRELEALYDHYCDATEELTVKREALAQCEQQTDEAQQRVIQMLERFRTTFQEMDEEILGEEDVQVAAGRAIERYQEYREAKTMLSDARALVERHQKYLREISQQKEQVTVKLAAIEQKIEDYFETAGLDTSSWGNSLKEQLAAYHKRVADHRENFGRLALLKEKAAAQEQQLLQEQAVLDRHKEQLDILLKKAGSPNVTHFLKTAEQAREYQKLRSDLTLYEEQLSTLMRGQDIHQLRAFVKAHGDLPPLPEHSAEALKQQSEALSEEIDLLMKEEHQLHINMAESAAGQRSLNEIEEDMALVQQQIQTLEQELKATSHAIALIETIACDKHAKIAPHLAQQASEYLKMITDSSYEELYLSRDLTISVRIPKTNQINTTPEKSLSKGTVDQIYLALRLALVQSLSAEGERVPMLLDDPFANYDDVRLEKTMDLIKKLSEKTQIMLFTCRDDVVKAGEKVGAAILQL